MKSIIDKPIPHLLSALALAGALGCSTSIGAHVTLAPLGTHVAGLFLESAAEIPAHDPATQRLFVVNAQAAMVDVLDIQDPTNPTLVDSIAVQDYGAVANSVSVSGGVVAIAVESAVKTDPGQVVFVDAASLAVLHAVPVGALPDMLTFSPDGQWVLVANEGEPSDDYLTDPEGSVSVIDLSGGVANATVRTADFSAFNGAALEASIRVFGPGASVAQDLEPEYIAISADSTTAWVTLQENNAVAVVDIASATVLRLAGLGHKDHSLPGNALDASDRDGVINIQTWPVKGMFLPDAIAAYQAQGQTFLVLANEGDSRDYDGFGEEARIGDVKLNKKVYKNDNREFFGNSNLKELQASASLGRLKITTTQGDTDGDGDFDELYTFGARSFSIRDANGHLIFDSGDEMETIMAFMYPLNFNASNDGNSFDNRSDDKGPEPEGVTMGEAFGRTLAFVGLERMGGVMVYDVSDPFAPVLQDYVNNRNFEAEPETPEAGDLGPEGLAFISAANSPTGQPLLVVANEVSGTTTIYEVREVE